MNFEKIYENDDFIIINKFEGISYNNEAQNSGLFTELKEAFGEIYSVHRLDKVTSGLLIIAKNSHVASEFGRLFQKKLIEKYYIALSDKKPKKKQGLIIGDMIRSRASTWKLLKEKINPAITYFFSFSVDEGIRLFILKPLTGKTHQLRVALKSIGAPILGDSLYSGSKSDRVYLHSARLIFSFKGESYDFFTMPKNGELMINEKVKEKIDEIDFSLLKWPQKKIKGTL